MTNGCAGASLLHAHASDGVCVRARTRTHLAMCLYVFACLSHDVLWQSLTNRTGASGRWGGGGGLERAIGGCRVKKRSSGAAEGGTRADCCHMMGI